MSQQLNSANNTVTSKPVRPILRLKTISASPEDPKIGAIKDSKELAPVQCIKDAAQDNQQLAVTIEKPLANNVVKTKKKIKYPITNKQYQEILQLVQEKYPLAFNAEYKPLAIHIHKQLFTELSEIAKKKMKGFLAKYCRSKEYVATHLVGTARIDLYGNVVGEVLEDQEKRKQRFLASKEKLKKDPEA